MHACTHAYSHIYIYLKYNASIFQIIPLYQQQHQETLDYSDDKHRHNTGTGMAVDGAEDADNATSSVYSSYHQTDMSHDASYARVIPPPLLMDYPPLSYLLNGILVAFQLLNECPVGSHSQKYVRCLHDMLVELCHAIVSQANHFRVKGNMYLNGTKLTHFYEDKNDVGNGKKDNGSNGSGNDHKCLDLVYLYMLRSLLIPFTLHSFEHMLKIVGTCENVDEVHVSNSVKSKDGAYDSEGDAGDAYPLSDERCREIWRHCVSICHAK